MNIENFTNFDYIVLSIIFISTIFAFVKGFIKSIIAISGWCIIAYISYSAHPYIEPVVKKFISNSIGVKIADFSLSFIIAVIISSIFTGRLYRLTQNIRGGFFDRVIGGFFGFIRGSVICCIIIGAILGICKVFLEEEPKFFEKSETYPILQSMNTKFKVFLPNSIRGEMVKIGSYKSPEELNSNLILGQIIKMLSSNKNSHDNQKYIDKLQNENISKTEKYRILELIYKETRNDSDSYIVNGLIKKLLKDSEEKDKHNDQLNNQLERLIDSD